MEIVEHKSGGDVWSLKYINFTFYKSFSWVSSYSSPKLCHLTVVYFGPRIHTTLLSKGVKSFVILLGDILRFILENSLPFVGGVEANYFYTYVGFLLKFQF